MLHQTSFPNIFDETQRLLHAELHRPKKASAHRDRRSCERTEERRLDPVSVAHLEEVCVAALRVRDVEGRDVQHDLLAVGRRDAPLTQRLRLLHWCRRVVVAAAASAASWRGGRTEDAARVLQRAAATCTEKERKHSLDWLSQVQWMLIVHEYCKCNCT